MKNNKIKVTIAVICAVILLGVMTALLIMKSCSVTGEKPVGSDSTSELQSDSKNTPPVTEDSESISAQTSSAPESISADTSSAPESTKNVSGNSGEPDIPNSAETDSLFKYNQQGMIIGSPADYDNLVISINKISVSAKDYFSKDRTEILEKWYGIIKEVAAWDSYYPGGGVFADFDKKEFMKQLHFTANNSQITYGSHESVSDNRAVIDFSINGVRLGDSFENIEKTFGTLHTPPVRQEDGSLVCGYVFESGGQFSFYIYDNMIGNICLALSQ